MLEKFEADPETEYVVLVGEIGGNEEEKAAAFIAERMTKPVLAYIAGFSAPPGKTMGHAGAIISGTPGTAQAKKEALEAVGIAVGTTPTEVAQLVAERVGAPGVISFSRGVPAPECLPVEELAECARSVLLGDGRTMLSYGSPSGYEPLREWIAERHGVAVDRVFVTNGGLQGFVFFAQRLAANGERVLVEQPTYDRPLKILRELGAEIVPLPMDEEGLDPESLEAALADGSKPGVPVHDSDLPEPERAHALPERRRRIVELAGRTTCSCSRTIPTGWSASRASRSLRCSTSSGGDRVVYASSFSKTVAPGLRVGYFVLPASLRAELEATSTSTYITPGLLGQATVYEFIRRGNFDTNLEAGSSAFWARDATRCSSRSRRALAGTGATWSRPLGRLLRLAGRARRGHGASCSAAPPTPVSRSWPAATSAARRRPRGSPTASSRRTRSARACRS